MIGHKFDDAAVQADIKNFTYNVVKGKGGDPLIELETEPGQGMSQFTPSSISAIVLKELKKIGESKFDDGY